MFYLLGSPAETAYLSVRDGKLSYAVLLVEFRPREVAVHTFLGWFQGGMLGLRAGTIENHNFYVLGPIMEKFHIRTRLFESFQLESSYSSVLRPILVKLHILTRLIGSLSIWSLGSTNGSNLISLFLFLVTFLRFSGGFLVCMNVCMSE